MRHRLPVILAVGLAAVLASACSFAAIGEWVADQPEQALAGLGVGTGGRPAESTIRRALARLDADLLDRVIGAFLWTRTHVVASRRVIAIDGKTVRGARTANAVAPHLVAAFDHVAGTVLEQVAVAAKSNEIPAEDLPWKDVPGHRVTTTGHGRRTVTRGGKKSVEVVYLITSADHHGAPPATLAAWVQGTGASRPAALGPRCHFR